MDEVRSLLTVEEAARVLRVGRTKAYAMAWEWRATGGHSGLPVIDFGHVLRVPRCELEALVGGPLTAEGTGADTHAAPVVLEATPATKRSTSDEPDPTDPDPTSSSSRAPRRRSRRRTGTPGQRTLPFAG